MSILTKIFFTAAVVLPLVLAACGPNEEKTLAPGELEPPARGFQLKTERVLLEPGEEIEYCDVFVLPGSPGEIFAVNKLESAMTPNSHHLIVSTIEPDSEMDRGLPAGARRECPLGARQFGDQYLDVFGSQAPYREDALPDGVGRFYRGGQKLIIDYHYFNASDGVAAAQVSLNFHEIDVAAVEREARNDGFYNLTISIPAGEERTFTGECAFSEDVYVHKLVRHTHHWGTDFSVWYAGGERDGTLAFSSAHYEDTEEELGEPALMKAGEGFRFSCTYVNTEDATLRFGNTVNDEMCILFMTWWTATPGATGEKQECYLSDIDEDGVARP